LNHPEQWRDRRETLAQQWAAFDLRHGREFEGIGVPELVLDEIDRRR
jgi:hypothetical protein